MKKVRHRTSGWCGRVPAARAAQPFVVRLGLKSMRKTCLVTLAFIASSALASWNHLPKESLIKKYRESVEPQYNGSDIFAPIGFSHDGLFAYFCGELCSERGGVFEGTLVIQNLLDDATVHRSNFDEENYDDSKIKTILDASKIQGQTLSIKKFPLNYQGDTFDAVLDSVTISVDEYGAKTVRNKLFLVSDNRGRKLVDEFETVNKLDYPRGPFSVVGLIQSPFEPSIALITDDWGSGEGNEGCRTHWVKVYGASLKGGFKQ